MPPTPALTAVTRRAVHEGSLLPLTSSVSPLALLRSGDGVVGRGEALRLTFRGAARIADAASAWARIAAAASIDDDVRMPGTGLITFGAFAFDDDSAEQSVLVVPRVVHGRAGDVSWTTRISVAGEPLDGAGLDDARPDDDGVPIGHAHARLSPGDISLDRYAEAVSAATRLIDDGSLEKIVLARDVAGTLEDGADIRAALARLAVGYPTASTYAVDGLIGASPETLVRASEGRFFTRVLAGSAARRGDASADADAREWLTASDKERSEHAFAADSALASLGRVSSDVAASAPFVLELPNLWHLATDITGTLGAASTFDVLAELHPTAAVAGTPRQESLAQLRRLEGVDRGRYAGPVGWADASGGGEWVIALRGAQVRGREVRAFAGAGIVHDSRPESELAETSVKLRPIVEALGS